MQTRRLAPLVAFISLAACAATASSANLPDPDVIAAQIVEDLEAVLAQSAEIATDLKR